jgi:hypothetical protein
MLGSHFQPVQGCTGGHIRASSAYHPFVITTGRYHEPRRCPLSSLKAGEDLSSSGLPSSSSNTENNASLLDLLACFGGVHPFKKKVYAGAYRSRPPVQSIHTHIHCPMQWPVASFYCFFPPPSFTLAVCRALFLPAFDEARMSTFLQSHLIWAEQHAI